MILGPAVKTFFLFLPADFQYKMQGDGLTHNSQQSTWLISFFCCHSLQGVLTSHKHSCWNFNQLHCLFSLDPVT